MESKEWRRKTCLDSLQFLGLDSTTESLETWKSHIYVYIRDITRQIEYDLKNYSDVEIPRAVLLAQLSVLAILISREFDAALMAVITIEWDSFDALFESEKKHYEAEGRDWHDFRTREVFWWCRQLARWTEKANEGANEPVREIEPWEKRLWCEDIVRSLPRTAAPFEQEPHQHNHIQSWRRYKEVHRLHLSIELHTPVEVIKEKVAEIVKRYQEINSKEYMESFQHEINQGALDADSVIRWLEEDRLMYDDPRNDQQERRGSLKGKAEKYLQYLEIYRMKRLKYSPLDIAKHTGIPSVWEIHINENNIKSIRDAHRKRIKKAQELIQAALQGKSPLTVSIS